MTRHRFELDVSSVAPSGVSTIAGDIHLPEGRHRQLVLACCLPGGGMSRRYFDLRAATSFGETTEADRQSGPNYSMATHLVRAGFAVATIDHPGVGESGRPDDGFTLTPQVIADVDAHAVELVRKGLESGTLVDDVGPIVITRTIGVGHSAGAIVTVHLQARHGLYDGLALLGFGGRGWREQLTDEELAVADDPEAIRASIVELARERFGEALPMPRRGSSDLLVASPMAPEAHAALVDARTNLLAVLGLSSMIPGSMRPDIDAVDVPVFIGVGERDIAGAPRRIPESFPRSNDITVFVLPGAGHNHNVHADREVLWERVVRWVRAAFD
jgi:pimeloyl-ACP methyl ester carboxylesterase